MPPALEVHDVQGYARRCRTRQRGNPGKNSQDRLGSFLSPRRARRGGRPRRRGGGRRQAREIAARARLAHAQAPGDLAAQGGHRSEEHTSELQSLMRISYAVFRLKKKKIIYTKTSISTLSTP